MVSLTVGEVFLVFVMFIAMQEILDWREKNNVKINKMTIFLACLGICTMTKQVVFLIADTIKGIIVFWAK